MKYLMLIKHSQDLRTEEVPQALMDAMGPFIEGWFKTGKLKDTAGLKPTTEAFRVRQSGGKIRTTDGPFSEAKEVVGGYAIIETATEPEARDLALQFMQLHLDHWPEFEGECEVRPMEQM